MRIESKDQFESLKAQSLEKQVFRLTGKRGRSQNDDLCIAALMAPYWREVFWSSKNEAYARAKRQMRQ